MERPLPASRWPPAPARRSPPPPSSSSSSAPAMPGACCSSWTGSNWRTRRRRLSRRSSRTTSRRHLQGEPRRLAPCRDRRHHRPVAAVQQQIPAALLAHRLRPRHLRRSAPLHRRQRPRRLRLLHRLQARPHRHAARLPQAVRQAKPATDPREAERRLCSIPTAPSAARTASPPSATRCSMA